MKGTGGSQELQNNPPKKTTPPKAAPWKTDHGEITGECSEEENEKIA